MSAPITITEDEVKHLASLARLVLTKAEIERYTAQFGDTLEYVKNLSELKTDDLAATNAVVAMQNVGFEDGTTCTRGLTQEEATANAKAVSGGAFRLDRIMQ